MCGIACFVGENAPKTCFEMLKKLEYRGYDSSGMAALCGEIELFRRVGEVENIRPFAERVESLFALSHTRWATHGVASERNAHPHLSFDGKFALVHNGIVENCKILKKNLEKRQILFKSETDSEVAVNVFALLKGNLVRRAAELMRRLKGNCAFAILSKDEKKIVAMRRGAPLFLGKNEKGIMVASDVVCFFKSAASYYALKEGEVAIIGENEVSLYGADLGEKNIAWEKVDENAEEIARGGYSHFMEKEINEIPATVKRLEAAYGVGGFEKVKNLFSGIDNIFLVGCGTAYHACLFGARVLEEKLKIPCHAYVASELKYSSPIIKNALGIFVSQSGETADTLGCLELFKGNAKTLAITNVSYSTLAQSVDEFLPVFAGTEIAVASTKAYVAQIVLFSLLASYLGGEKKNILEGFAEKTKEVLKIDENLVSYILSEPRIFFIGRRLGSITSLEAALKLKEISYKCAEGYPAGELKHGTIALIEEGTPVVVFLTDEALAEKTLSSLEEVRSRGAKIILVATKKFRSISCDFFIELPSCSCPFLYSALAIIPFQLLAFSVSLRLGYNPDKPRNLAKSVTVE